MIESLHKAITPGEGTAAYAIYALVMKTLKKVSLTARRWIMKAGRAAFVCKSQL